MKFNLFKTERKDVTAIDGDTMIELENGKSVKFAEMVNALEKKNEDDDKKKKEDEKDEKVNSETIISVGGKDMKLGDAVKLYGEMCNAEDEAKKKESENEADDDEDSDEAKKKKADADKEKENAKKKGKENFNDLKEAANSIHHEQVMRVDTPAAQLERGRQKY